MPRNNIYIKLNLHREKFCIYIYQFVSWIKEYKLQIVTVPIISKVNNLDFDEILKPFDSIIYLDYDVLPREYFRGNRVIECHI